MKLHPATRTRFEQIVSVLLKWHHNNKRSFVWRGLKRSPYVVMVSEFMLQQTGAKQVEKHLPAFLRKFPSVKSLAAASRPEVIRAWHGLGYNRRAINLHEAAKAIVANNRFPKTLEELLALPGIGLYTASAILAFARNADIPVVDVNIERVLSRLWKRMPDTHAKLPIREVYSLDEAILPSGKSSDWHEALMDLGSTICTKKSPTCGVCPINTFCPSSGKLKAPKGAVSSKERLYFGHPRRIWRGRILHAIAEMEPISASKLAAILKNQFQIRESTFVPFVISVLEDLNKEGFLTRSSKKGFSLANHE